MANWLDKYEQGGLVLKQKAKDNYGKKENANAGYSTAGPGWVGEGTTNRGFNYNGAWGGTMEMGGSMPGAVGFTYARVAGSAPANGKYTKKTKASAQNGQEMKFYQEGLDFKPKSISKNGSVIKDDMGQWAHPGEITEIDSNDITMQGVDYPVLGISDTGDTQMMQPGQDYKFDGEKVTEYPMAQDGTRLNVDLKKQAEEFLARQNANRTTMSQYTPKPGEQAKFDKQKLQRIQEDNAPLNRMAASQGAANIQDAIEAAMIMEGGMFAGKLIGKGAKAAAKYATEQTALKNAYKLNPYAFKPNKSNWYRQVGDPGYEDAIKTGMIRGVNEDLNKSMLGKIDEPYFYKGEPFFDAIDIKPTGNQSDKFLIEGKFSTGDIIPAAGDNRWIKHMNNLSEKGILDNIDFGVVQKDANLRNLENFNVYQKNWLKRYKEVPKPKSSINNIGTELESEISKLKQKEVLAEESRKNLWADYKAGKITGEEYTISAKKLNPTPFDNPRHKLEQQLREHKVKQDIINTPQQNILKSESQLGKNISDGGSNTKGVFELGDDYVARLSAHGYDDASRLVNYTDKIKSPRISKTLQVKEIDGKVYQVQEKATGTPITKLSSEDYKNIPKQHIDNFWKDKTELDKLGLSIDISGGKSNVFYNKNKGFQFIDLGIGKNESNKVISETLKLPKSNSGWLNKYK